MQPIVIVLFSILGGIFYTYWRYMRVQLRSPFRAFDLVFLTISVELSVVFIALFTGLDGNIGINSIDLLFSNFSYLVLLLLPVAAFQFMSMSLVVNQSWREQLVGPVLVSLASILVFALIHSGISLTTETETSIVVMGILLTLITAGSIIVAVYLLRKKMFKPENILALLTTLVVVIQLLIWLISGVESQLRSVISIVLIVEYVLVALPILMTRSKRTQRWYADQK